ncbi:hypothetical protein BGZ46_001842 [Entomortierella lignicola]|nr:hypothetical protein BGZ46_001842 [Entomortierella lignicola]
MPDSREKVWIQVPMKTLHEELSETSRPAELREQAPSAQADVRAQNGPGHPGRASWVDSDFLRSRPACWKVPAATVQENDLESPGR